MQVKEAVSLAKAYIKDVFADEEAENPGLEEIEYDDKTGIWSVTVGFARRWDEAAGPFGAKLGLMAPKRRDYKVVRIVDGDKRVISVKNRETIAG